MHIAPALLGIDFHPWIPIVAAILLTVAWIGYLRTTPAVSARLRFLLVSLRVAAFLLLVFALLDPRYVRFFEEDEPARVVALVDRSASMTLPASGWDDRLSGSRFEAAERLSGELEAAVRERHGEYRRFYFSNDLQEAAGDSAGPDGQGTDIIASLQAAHRRHEGEHVAALVLFTDGVETEERLIRRALPGVPVFAVGLGDTAPPEDVRIKEVDYNSVVRVPSQSTIQATVQYTGGREKRVSLKLSEGGRTIFENDTLMTPVTNEIVQRIPVSYPEAGRRQFTLLVEVDGEDAEKENNKRDIVVEAEKAKSKLLIVDLYPEWELHFLTDLLRRDQTFDFDVFSLPDRQKPGVGQIKDPGEFVAGLTDCDAVVIASLTDAFFTSEVAAAVKRFVIDRGGGLLVLPGTASLFERPAAWNHLNELLPVRGTPPFRWNLQYTSVLPGAQAGANPVTAHLLPLLGQTEWQERSPLLGFYTPVAAKPIGEVLLNVKGRALPAVTYRTIGKGRVAVVSAGPLWRWRFLSENNTIYDEIVSRLLEVLSRGEETDRFVVVAEKNVFDAGESPVFFAELFNEKMQPVTGVPVRIEVARLDETGNETPLDLIPMSRESAQNTRFKSVLSPLPPGRYLVRGQADLPDRSIGSRPLDIQISNTSVEFRRVQQDRALLEGIARRSGGAYTNAGGPPGSAGLAGFLGFAGRIEVEPRTVPSVSEVTMRTSFLLFAAIVILLSAEWVIRKRAGMI